MVIEVKNCKDCPFANNDNEQGRNWCNLADKLRREIKMGIWEELPEDRRHENCPLTEQLTIVVDLSA
jgi:hypothetical protein